ncbi:MAG: NUDIX domain-containing protein [Candidatus Eisenbacteria sp.]|nr:NUDIX domain-containing protein [Candidatus Eisenbacteria bacterium]
MSGIEGSGEIVGSGLEFRFCPLCGSPLLQDVGGNRAGLTVAKGSSRQAHCPKCGYVHYRNPIAVVAAILQSDGPHPPASGLLIPPSAATHLLLVRRTGIYPGTWCIPCGYVDYDEEVRAAAEREMLEETGLLVETGAVFAVQSNFHNPVNHTIGVWYLARRIGGELIPGDDADRAEFFSLDELPEPLAFPTDREVIARLRDTDK